MISIDNPTTRFEFDLDNNWEEFYKLLSKCSPFGDRKKRDTILKHPHLIDLDPTRSDAGDIYDITEIVNCFMQHRGKINELIYLIVSYESSNFSIPVKNLLAFWKYKCPRGWKKWKKMYYAQIIDNSLELFKGILVEFPEIKFVSIVNALKECSITSDHQKIEKIISDLGLNGIGEFDDVWDELDEIVLRIHSSSGSIKSLIDAIYSFKEGDLLPILKVLKEWEQILPEDYKEWQQQNLEDLKQDESLQEKENIDFIKENLPTLFNLLQENQTKQKFTTFPTITFSEDKEKKTPAEKKISTIGTSATESLKSLPSRPVISEIGKAVHYDTYEIVSEFYGMVQDSLNRDKEIKHVILGVHGPRATGFSSLVERLKIICKEIPSSQTKLLYSNLNLEHAQQVNKNFILTLISSIQNKAELCSSMNAIYQTNDLDETYEKLEDSVKPSENELCKNLTECLNNFSQKNGCIVILFFKGFEKVKDKPVGRLLISWLQRYAWKLAGKLIVVITSEKTSIEKSGLEDLGEKTEFKIILMEPKKIMDFKDYLEWANYLGYKWIKQGDLEFINKLSPNDEINPDNFREKLENLDKYLHPKDNTVC